MTTSPQDQSSHIRGFQCAEPGRERSVYPTAGQSDADFDPVLSSRVNVSVISGEFAHSSCRIRIRFTWALNPIHNSRMSRERL
jgi:hypothetical protein